MKSKARVIAVLTALICLGGCGKVEGTSDSSSLLVSSQEDVVEDSSSQQEEESEIDLRAAEEVKACSLVIASGYSSEDITAVLSGAAAMQLYETAVNAVNGAEEADRPNDQSVISVCFMYEDESRTIVSVFDDGVFCWAQEDGAVKYFKSEQQSVLVRDELAAYAALKLIFQSDEVSLGEREDSDGERLIAACQAPTDGFEQSYLYYVSDTSYREVTEAFDGAIGYRHEINIENSETANYYEYICSLDENVGYERYDSDCLWTKAAVQVPNRLPIDICMYYSASKQFSVSVEGEEYTCEMWQANESEQDKWFVLFDMQGEICGGWFVSGADFENVMCGYTLEDAASEELEDTLADVQKALGEEQESDDELIQSDNEQYDLFDLTGEIVRGDTIENPTTVKTYQQYFAESLAYTSETYCTGAGRLEHHIQSCDDTDYYIRWDTIIHGESESLGSEEICVGDKCYSSIYEIEQYDTRSYTSYPRDEYNQMVVEQLFDPEYKDELEFTDAYYVTVDGTEYECEEWTVGLHDYTVYSQDGVIKGFETDFYGEPVVYTVVRFEFEGDSQLIKAPESSSEYVSGD